MAAARIEDVEMGFGYIDPDAGKVYAHGVCPCDAASGATAPCNCSD